MVVAPVSAGSASGLLALLEEPDVALQVAALRGLHKVVDTHWAEVSSSLARLEACSEDDAFPERQLASLLAAKACAPCDGRQKGV
jgi:26S proteasome regulatory subunit N2